MNRLTGIPGKRYEEIKEIIADMYEDLGYAKLPVNVYELCHRLNIKLSKYSYLSAGGLEERAKQFSKDGFSIFNKNTRQNEIYYNDRMPEERITFTIMHEIAHIMMEHNVHTPANEKEANFFAKTALAPLGLIYLLHLKNSAEIAETFGISMEFAGNIVRHFNKAMIYPGIRQKEADCRLVRLFYLQYMEAG